jgi:predicted small secreted protein
MSNGKFNSEQIILKVKDFFEKTRAMKTYLFTVEKCNYEEKTNRWVVVCTFIANPFTGKEHKYKVEIDGDTGAVLNVNILTEI